MLNKIISHLDLPIEEEVYLELLVLQGNATNQAAKMRYLKMMEQNSNYQKYNRHETEAYRYLTHWYYVAIREMTAFKDFSDDPGWIAKRLKNQVPKQDIAKALKFLLEKGFIKQDKNGKYIPPEKTIQCYDGVFKLVLAQFHKEMFDLSIKSIHNTPRDYRNIKGHTFSIPQDQINRAKQIIDEAEQKLVELGNKASEGDIIMQGQLAVFPLTKLDGEES